MRGVRNPFRISTSESIETDTDFLRLFGPGVIDLLPGDAISGGLLYIRSAPGAGKTTLLRLFTPSVLLSLLALRGSDPYREIFSRLRRLEVVDDSGLRVFGVMLSCRQTFPSLEELRLEKPRSDRLFRALLDARILMGALRSALVGRHLRYPEDLDRIALDAPESGERFSDLPLPCDGRTAKEWAERLELTVCDTIDSLQSVESIEVRGHDSLNTLALLDACAVRIDGKPLGCKWLVMLDDVHKLSAGQRATLNETLLEGRSSTATWVAERFEALTTSELLATGALEGRDYDTVVNLEEAWGKGKGRKSFSAAVAVIAERRARMAADVAAGSSDVGSFAAALDPGQDSVEFANGIESAVVAASDKIEELTRGKPQYRDWVDSRKADEGTPRQRLIGLRALEILIERDIRKKQLTLGFDRPVSELEQRENSSVRNAAELFLAAESGFPYYFGSDCVANLGFQNVEQYLRLAGDLFEESLSAALIDRSPVIPAARQEHLLTRACETRIKELPRRAGRDVLRFVESVGQYCKFETYRPNAPYAPGVTGIALSMTDRERLLNNEVLAASQSYKRFAEMLAAALSQNVFRAILDHKVKGGRYMVLYLNRIICVRYRLPLHYGGFKEKPLEELVGWLARGFTKKEELSL